MSAGLIAELLAGSYQTRIVLLPARSLCLAGRYRRLACLLIDGKMAEAFIHPLTPLFAALLSAVS